MSKQTLYKVIFLNQGKLYEIYAQTVRQSNLHGFIEVESLKFGQASSLVVDPHEEKLKAEFAGVNVTFLPVHLISRIDQVDKEGISKISDIPEDIDNIMPFPGATFGKPEGKND